MSFYREKTVRFVRFAFSISTLFLHQITLADIQNDCFKSANLAFGSDASTAAEVCEGAETLFPALCFRNAVNMKGISPKTAAELCKNAVNMVPSDCFRTATALNGLSEENALKLCKVRPPGN